MAVATGEIYQVTYQSSIQGQTVENVIHFRERTGTSTPAQIATSAQTFNTQLANLLPTAQIMTQIIIKQMTPLAFDEQLIVPTTASGQQSSAYLTNMVALIFTKRTGVSGKSHRGRVYVGAIPSVFTTDDNRLNTTGATAAGTFASAVMNAYKDGGTDAHLQIGVYSRAIGGSHPFTVAGWQPLTSLDTQIIFGSQRRRRVGVGI